VNGFYRRFAVAWLVSVGVGCTSAPVRYYTLIPAPGKTLPASEARLAVDVRVVHTPPQLNHAELVVRTGPTEVTFLENERWASPVKDEFKDALRIDLQRRLSQTPELRPAYTKLALDIDVQHLEAELGQYAHLEVSWRATPSVGGGGTNVAGAATCTFQADEKIHAGYAGIVEGYQREITALADSIAVALTSRASGIDVPCH
jgi:uncharacterized lipoprotein YmbA